MSMPAYWSFKLLNILNRSPVNDLRTESLFLIWNSLLSLKNLGPLTSANMDTCFINGT